MPRYEYVCPVCRMEFEAFALIKDRDKVCCSRCGDPAKRVMRSAPGIAFRGSGWTRNESGWHSLQQEKAKSDREIAAFNKEMKDKAFEKALNEAKPWSDQDHADYEKAERANREAGHENSRILIS